MIFEEDAILLSFFEKYTEPDEEEELKESVIKYVGGGNFGGKAPIEEQNTTGESLDDVSLKYLNHCLVQISSPMDSGIATKKRKRLQALQQAKEKKEESKQGGISLGIGECDIGASPQMAKGSIYSKKTNAGGGKMSPLIHANKFNLGARK